MDKKNKKIGEQYQIQLLRACAARTSGKKEEESGDTLQALQITPTLNGPLLCMILVLEGIERALHTRLYAAHTPLRPFPTLLRAACKKNWLNSEQTQMLLGFFERYVFYRHQYHMLHVGSARLKMFFPSSLDKKVARDNYRLIEFAESLDFYALSRASGPGAIADPIIPPTC